MHLQGDGVTLEGWLFEEAGPRRGTVVYLHGSASNREGGLGLGRHFLPRGFDLLAYDSRAHGRSGGEACTYGFYEKRDLARVLETGSARRRRPLDASPRSRRHTTLTRRADATENGPAET